MRKTILTAASAATLLLATSCGMPLDRGMQTSEQPTPAAGYNGMGQAAGGIGQTLINLLSGALIPTEMQICGTWEYQSPAVVFNSQNALASLGGSVVSSGIENKMQTYLAKYGISSGNTTITFNQDKTFVVKTSKRTITGTYTVVNQAVQMTFTGMTQPCRMTPQLDNGTLVIVADATKLKDFLQGMGTASGNQQLDAITSLMKQFSGMQLGIRMKKR